MGQVPGIVGWVVAASIGLAPVTPLRAGQVPVEPTIEEPIEAPIEDAEIDEEEAAAPAPEQPVEASVSRSSSRLAVLPVLVTGSQDAGLAVRIRGYLQSGLARGAFALVDVAEVERLAGGSCEAGECLAGLGKGTGATFALRARVTVNDRDYVIRLELLRIEGGVAVATSEEHCDLCGRGEVGTLVETQAALLRHKLEDLIQGPPMLVLTSQPSGALVYIDDELVGQTPLERTSIAGTHNIRVVLAGYVPEVRQLVLATGVREAIEVPLRRSPRALRRRSLGWAGVGLGIPAVAAGVVLLVLDGREIRSDCSAGDRNQDVSGRCRYLHDTDWGGAVALAAGAALIAVGATLLRMNRPVKQRRVQLEAAGMGLRGRF